MGELLLRVLAIGLVAAVVPVPILIALVLLTGPQGLRRAWWFVFGFAGSLAVVGAATLLITETTHASLDPRMLGVVGLVIGVVLLLLATRLALRRRSGHASIGSQAVTLGGLSHLRVATLGIVAGALNPKTLPIYLTGIAAIAVADAPVTVRSLALLLLTGVASAGVVLPPLLLTAAPGPRTARFMERVRRASEPHAESVAILLLALVGLAYVLFGAVAVR